MKERILVTGGNGFIAGWCLVELLRQGHAVRCTLRDAGRAGALRETLAAQGVDASALQVVQATLDSDAGWDAAVQGCTRVLHIASPLGASRDRAGLLEPARDGTLRVLRAARRAGVRRLVMTSAAAAARVLATDGEWISDESAWPDAATQRDPYRRSKILAERAAWDEIAREPGHALELATILPAAVFGPPLAAGAAQGSVQVIQRLLQGRPPAIPRLGFSIVDVRDLAELHLRALFSPAAAGQRFVAAGEYMTLRE
ncbi:NAD-dependent epimerase/dehydratase family protein, partial [Pelomonas sp. KK5]|uniref:NAD-dependent epimerase/dehydratase family protein n=1 Tax=Pelomonas sp. KK5 TaxID=1855730 RepID=UPI00097BB844